MGDEARLAVFPKSNTRPRLEGASYITQMLFELKSQADNLDWQLSYLIQMAAIHARDIDTGQVRAETAEQAASHKT